jgi:hypothetical protein
MNETDVMELPRIDTPKVDERGWRREYAAYLRMLPELLKAYRGKYVAVYGGQVVAVGDTFADAALAAYRHHGYVPLHVDLVSDQAPPVVRIPSPRVITSH